MDLFKFRKEMLINEIKSYKKNNRFALIALLFNLSLIAVNIWTGFHAAYPVINGISIGMNVACILLILLAMSENYSDSINNEYLLKYIEETEIKESYQGAIKQLERAREYYDDIARSTILAPNIVKPCPENKEQAKESQEAEKK